ncbi:SIR2 family NAD-dependent protein deacylase [Rathayibacter soli]|uniref:SIR2 family NAD-dependent protein deacylase n=1 Tax=Rathayibacter soli TaxID=3144168 RepID=UPI0027E5245F|nr:SIR2 family protein [Glaciibacter superstes]
MMTSHVFVILADLRHVNCDAWMLPTDREYRIKSQWLQEDNELGLRARKMRSNEFTSGEVLALAVADWPNDKPLPVLTAVPVGGVTRADDLDSAVEQFIEVGATQAKSRRASASEPLQSAMARAVPLLAMPVFGADGGGGGSIRGELLTHLLTTARRSAAMHGVDVVIVVNKKPKTFALAQQLRKRDASDGWPELTDAGLFDKAKELAQFARRGKLVPFMGAGVSVSAGAPSWSELIQRLAARVTLTEGECASLVKEGRSALDQAAFLRAKFQLSKLNPSEADGGFSQAIVDELRLTRYGLAPTLLASLGTDQAITLNYDELFEQASADAGIARTIIPHDTSSSSEKWLLKLHGSVDDPASIVLTRDDYLGYNSNREALSAIVKATLITHHLLFVGFGLADDHFQQIIYDVRRALPDGGVHSPDIATALTLGDDPLNKVLWSGHLDLIPMGAGTERLQEASRMLEIFLDALLAFSTDNHTYLLDPDFRSVLNQADKALAEGLLQLAAGASDAMRSSSAWPAIARAFADVGFDVSHLELAARGVEPAKPVPLPSTWNRSGLEHAGFAGFRPFSQLATSPPPKTPGIYVVLRTSKTGPTFMALSRIGKRDGLDLSYPVEDLQTKWLAEAEVLYIGKANATRGLRSRLRQYGSLAPNHSGGRSIWQLADADELLVAWAETQDQDPAVVESAYLHAFSAEHGALPFANRRH